MGVKRIATSGEPPERYLTLALGAEDAEKRLAYAHRGLSCDDDELGPDTHVLLLRQAYLAHLELRQLQQALETAEAMVRIGAMSDTAHHDAARAHQALGDLQSAIASQRLAARAAPPERRSFHLWSLATLHHFAGEHEQALRVLERAEGWARRDRPLIRAHAAWIQLDAGRAVPDLRDVTVALEKSPNGQGYGQFLLGMIASEMGDAGRAAVHLRAFLRRNASIDTAKALTLREELRRARVALAAVSSD